jgi:hypothetical protein
MGQANLKAVTDTAIGFWKGRSGTDGKPLPIRTHQEDACRHIIPAHLLDRPEMSIKDLFEAVPTLELGVNVAAALLQ